ncbi:MAG: prenyltransferase [Candidatus Bathyarchaeia archaeon]
MGIRIWMGEALEPSLLMSFLLVSLGTAAAIYEGFLNLTFYILAIVGVTLAQNAVNVLNDYHDFKTGVDARTMKTPFSGGSRFLVSGLIKPRSAFLFGMTSLLLAIPIGVFFIILRGATLLVIAIVAGISILFYTTTFARVYLGEFLAGLNLGPLVIYGAYYVQAAGLSIGILAAGIAPGIMIAMVLYLNEIPDIEADAGAGRRNLPILLGRKRAAGIYAVVESFAVIWILIATLTGITPVPTLLALGCLPFALKAIRVTLKSYDDVHKLIPALGANIATAYVTIALLTVGYLVSIVLRM